ncbi:MAG: hypothetical protein K6F20_03370 [Bacteroidaceae bacterium]|nr:hypothetical protein [Bacteroidaceae bacterium]
MKMRIVQTFWTGNNDPLEYSYGWLHPEYNLMSWALSCLSLRVHYKDVVLYTDSKGYHILINILKLPYSEVHVVYDKLKCLSHHWAMAKLMTYYSQEEKFLHIDGDIYLVKPLPKRILNARLIAQNREIGSRYYQAMIDNILKQKTISVPDFIKESIEETSLCSYNTGFFGGRDLGFIRKYCEQAFYFMESNNMNNPKIKHSATDCNVFFEQVFLASMTKKEKRKVTCVLNREMLDQGYSIEDFCNLTQFSHKQFFHILGGHKQNMEICKQLAQILLSKYPAYCLKILSLFPLRNVRFLIEKENKSILGVEMSLAQYEDFLLKQRKEWTNIPFEKLFNLEKAITCYSRFVDMQQSERKKIAFVLNPYIAIYKIPKTWNHGAVNIVGRRMKAKLHEYFEIAIRPTIYDSGLQEVAIGKLALNIISLLENEEMTFEALVEKLKPFFVARLKKKSHQFVFQELEYLLYNGIILLA